MLRLPDYVKVDQFTSLYPYVPFVGKNSSLPVESFFSYNNTGLNFRVRLASFVIVLLKLLQFSTFSSYFGLS